MNAGRLPSINRGITKMELTKGALDAPLLAAAQLCEAILQSCQTKFSESNDLNKFFEYFNKASPHSSLLSLYANLYTILGIDQNHGDQSYFYHRIKMAGDNVDFSILARFKRAEKKWDMFVSTIDSLLADQRKRRASKSPITLKEDMRFIECGEKMSSVTLQKTIDAKEECKYSLLIMIRYMGCDDCASHVLEAERRREEFAAKFCNLLVVCRATREGATQWRKTIGVQTPVLADEHGDFVRAIDFRSSVAMFSNSAFIHECALKSTERVSSRQSASRLDDIYNCIYQLGGDVVIDEHRHVLFVYKSRTPKDRLSIDDLLQKVPFEQKMAVVDEELLSYDNERTDANLTVKFQANSENAPAVDIEVSPPKTPHTKMPPLRSPPPRPNGPSQGSSCCTIL